MKKFILFALMLSVTAIGNNTFAASKSINAENVAQATIAVQIDAKNTNPNSEPVKSQVIDERKVINQDWLCFASGSWEYASTAPDGSEYYNYVITITCYSYKSPFTAQY